MLPAERSDHAPGKFRQSRIYFAPRAAHMQNTHSGLVGHKCDSPPVMRQPEPVDVPGDFRRQILRLFRGQIEIGQPLKLRVSVCCDVNAPAVLAELSPSVRNLLFRITRCKRCFLARGRIHQPQIRFIDGQIFLQQNFLVVRRPIERLPASSLQPRQQPVRFRFGRIHHPQIHVFSGASS